MEQRERIIRKLLLVIPLVIIGILYKLSMIFFYIGDDTSMEYFASGHYTGNPDEHLVFINASLGYLLKVLYSITNALNWTAILYIIIVLVCTYTLLKIVSKYIGLYLALALSICVEIFCLYYLTFTTISYVCALLAVLMFIETISNNKRVINIVITCLFFILSYALRSSSFISAFLMLLPIIVFNIIKNRNKYTFITLGIVAVSLLSLFTTDNLSYSKEIWKEYSEFNTVRGELLDYHLPEYNQNKKLYNELEYSKNDLACLEKWFFGDKEVYSTRKLKTIQDNVKLSDKYDINIINWFKDSKFFNYSSWKLGMISIIALLIIGIYFSIKSKRNKWIIVLQMCFCVGEIIYLFIIQRPLARVIFSMVLVGIIAMAYFYEHNQEKETVKEGLSRDNVKNIFKSAAVLVCLVATFGLILYKMIDTKRENVNEYKIVQKINDYAKKNSKTLVLKDINHDYLNCIPINDSDEMYNEDNTMFIGDWTYYSDQYYRQLRKMQVKYKNATMLSLVEDNAHLMIDKVEDLDLIEKFLIEHYDNSIRARKIGHINDSNIDIYIFSK